MQPLVIFLAFTVGLLSGVILTLAFDGRLR